MSASGLAVVHVQRRPNLRETESLAGAFLPGLAFLMDRHAVLFNETVEGRPWNAQDADSFARADHRFLLHVPTVADVPIVPVVPFWYNWNNWYTRYNGVSRKAEWQRRHRAAFLAEHGYSERAHYGAGGNRQRILERDQYRCVRCGMTDDAHRARWGRPITIDHISRDRSDNSDANLQTLCLSCHGRKDVLPRLVAARVPERRAEIIARRKSGQTYQRIADDLGFSIGAIWKWARRWESETQAS